MAITITDSKTRKAVAIFGLGSAISIADAKITGCRLPTYRQILRCLMYNCRVIDEHTGKTSSKWKAAKTVLSQVSPFYAKAGIPMISENKACQKMIAFMDTNAKLREIPRKRRETASAQQKVDDMNKRLEETFPLWLPKAEEVMKNAEDIAFLRSMKSDRTATFGMKDKVTEKLMKRKEGRRLKEEARVKKERTRIEKFDIAKTSSSRAMPEISDNTQDSSEVSQEESESTDAAGSKRSHHRISRTGTSAFIPHNILQRPGIVALASRLKMSASQQATFTSALITESQGDISKVASSYATADRSRRSVVQQMALDIANGWVKPQLATLHWDSKVMQSLSDKNSSEERLVVLVGDNDKLQLLGTPSYKSGTNRKTGDLIADRTVQLLESWRCCDIVVNMSFDTTPANTGHISAAGVTVQQRLQRALLWSACRHHVGEVVLTQVFDSLNIEASKSPDVTLFLRFRKNFHKLPSSVKRHTLSRFGDAEKGNTAHSAFVADCRKETLLLADSAFDFNRDDYQEFVNLTALYLDTEATDSIVKFKKPGALHKARWMSKLIYSLKICLLENQIQKLPRGTITTQHQKDKLRAFVKFATLVYCSWWIKCTSAIDAPWNDLCLYRKLLQYRDVDSQVSDSALAAFRRHLWYLTAEMVPLSLFSDHVPAEERRSLADKMLAVRPDKEITVPKERFGSGFGKPKFPSVVTPSTTLADLVSADSWYTVKLLNLNLDFATFDVKDWSQCQSYETSVRNIKAINVVNDGAERAIKLSNDFINSSKSEQQYQSTLQVVSHDRKCHSNVRKRRLQTD